MLELKPYTHTDRAFFNPFRDMDEFWNGFWNRNDLSSFRTDIRDEGDRYELEADLPGFEKKDIRLDITDKLLTVRAERHSAHEEQDKTDKYVRHERTFGSYTRSFDLTGIDTDHMTARYENGVLKLTLPKHPKTPPESRQLEIE